MFEYALTTILIAKKQHLQGQRNKSLWTLFLAAKRKL